MFQWNGPGGAVQTVTGTYVDSAGSVQYQYPGVSRINPLGFKATLNAFVADGTAEVLSNPTILVLDGRQALIRIGTQIPNEQTTATNGYVSTTVNYINTGIVLNIRPRISEDGSEVTMQTETIVSSAQPVASTSKAPRIETKTIQSFVRVADNTPFIVGGLIDKKKTKGFTGIPVLSDIPLVGNLFKSRTDTSLDREVIIVLTPHVINTNEKSFRFTLYPRIPILLTHSTICSFVTPTESGMMICLTCHSPQKASSFRIFSRNCASISKNFKIFLLRNLSSNT